MARSLNFFSIYTVVFSAPSLKEFFVRENASLMGGVPFSSEKEFLEEKLVLGSMLVNSTKLQCRTFSGAGETMAYNQRPPSRKSISLVSTRHGFGADHWSSISAFVKASQTRSRSAANSRVM